MKKTLCILICLILLVMSGCAQTATKSESASADAAAPASEASLDEDDDIPDNIDDLPELPKELDVDMLENTEMQGGRPGPMARLMYNAALRCAAQNGWETTYSEEAYTFLEYRYCPGIESVFDGLYGLVVFGYGTGMHQSDYVSFITFDGAKTWSMHPWHTLSGLHLLGAQLPYVYAAVESSVSGSIRVSTDNGESFEDIELGDMLTPAQAEEGGYSGIFYVDDFQISDEDGSISFVLYDYDNYYENPTAMCRFVLDKTATELLSYGKIDND